MEAVEAFLGLIFRSIEKISKYRIPVVKERPSKCLHVKSKSCKNTCVKIKSFGIRLLKQKQN